MATEWNALYIGKYENWFEQGAQVYGIRGAGAKYDDFFEEFRQSFVPVWTKAHFPWTYVALDKVQSQIFEHRYQVTLFPNPSGLNAPIVNQVEVSSLDEALDRVSDEHREELQEMFSR